MIISENTCTSYIRRTLAFGYEIGTKSATYTRVITVGGCGGLDQGIEGWGGVMSSSYRPSWSGGKIMD